MRRSALLLCAALLLGLVGLAAPAQAVTAVDSTGTVYSTDKVVVPLVFPVIGPTSYSDTFLACRSGCTRKHMGEDLMGPKMSPLVAACDGTVVSQKRETVVGQGNYLVIACDHGPAAGWSAVYVHINNDTPGTDDGKGTAHYAFPTGIAVGVRVLAGQLVAWRGDSGDAESTGPHLHFELRKGTGWSGVVYSAFASLNAARHLTAARPSGPHPTGTLIRAATGTLFQVEGLRKRLVTPGVLAANRLSAGSAIDVTTEAARYTTSSPVLPRDGALVQDPDGAVWRVSGAQRYLATPADGEQVVPVAATDLIQLTVVGAPTVPLTSGMLVSVGGVAYELGADGQLHALSRKVMASWGWTPTDVHPWPSELPVPSVGLALGFRDGTYVFVDNRNAAVVTEGTIRRLWDGREVSAYGYVGKAHLIVDSASVGGLRPVELASAH